MAIAGLNFSGRKKLPIIRQAEAAECGLASIAMIAQYYGNKADLNGLRMVIPVSMRGSSLRSLTQVAEKLGLSSRPIRAELEYLKQIQLPAILHWDLNHFVVLAEIKKNHFKIHDPASGVKHFKLEEMSEHFTGVVLEVNPSIEFRPKLDVPTVLPLKISDFWSKIFGLKRAILQILVVTLIFQFFMLISPLYVQLVVDQALLRYDYPLLVVLTAFFIGVTVFGTIASFMRSWTILFFSNQMTFQLMGNVVDHLMKLPIEYYEKRHLGDILSRIESIKPIRRMLTETVIVVIIDTFLALITAIIILFYSVKIGLLILGLTTLNLIFVLTIYPFYYRKNESMIVAEAEERSSLMETLRGMNAIKLQGRETERNTLWRNYYATYINAHTATGKYQIIINAGRQLIDGLQLILVVFVGALSILNNSTGFTVGMLIAVMAYRQSFNRSFGAFIDKLVEFKLLKLHLDRLSDILRSPIEQKDELIDHSSSDDIFRVIEFKDVWFRYSPNDPWVLKGVNLQIKFGEFISIIGRSGEGKTTILKLLIGLYSPTKGEISVDGHNLKSYGFQRWRKKLGIVRQNDSLFSGSIAENISFFDSDIVLDGVHQAARRAEILEEIESMPMKFQSLIGDMGAALSGGQKQRLLLARALYVKPSALVLDEGTANLDPETEKKIVKLITNMKITRITVTHRTLLNDYADEVYELKDGLLLRME